jgi:hypothetical protein
VPKPLLALTVHQPWAWALAGGWKPIENREWPPPRHLFGRPLAIHAGRKYDGEAAYDLAVYAAELRLPRSPPPPAEIALGAIVAVGQVAGAVLVEEILDPANPAANRLEVREVRGAVSPERAVELAGSRWACGPWLWVLTDVVQVDPVPCRGMQKLWTVPPQITDAVRERFRAARRAA